MRLWLLVVLSVLSVQAVDAESLSKVGIYATYTGPIVPGQPLPLNNLYVFQDNGVINNTDPNQLTPLPTGGGGTVEQGTPPWKFSITDPTGAISATVTGSNALKIDPSAVTQPVNQTQVNGVAVSTGNGVAGTGVQRVTVASDNAAIPVTFAGATIPQTYMAATLNYTPPATPTDMMVIVGSGSKTIKILRIEYLATQGAAGVEVFDVIKRSTANTGGTTVAAVAVPADSLNAAATASVFHYSVNPATLGTSLGVLYNLRDQVPVNTSALQPIWKVLYEAPASGQPITLRGVNESVAINHGGLALPAGLSIAMNIIWTEQ